MKTHKDNKMIIKPHDFFPVVETLIVWFTPLFVGDEV